MGGASFWMLVAWTALDGGGGDGLAHLGSALNGTGRIAETKLRAEGIDPAAEQTHGDPVVKAQHQPESQRPEAVAPTHADAITDEESHKLERRLDACPVEVARRRQVPPAQVAAVTVTLRWTIEPNGHVRNAEAIAAAPETDLEVAACAKRVVTEWVFPKPPPAPVTVQRTYSFP